MYPEYSSLDRERHDVDIAWAYTASAPPQAEK